MSMENGKYYAVVGFIGDGVDKNSRYVYRWPEEHPIVIMNFAHNPWTSEDEGILAAIIELLNGMGSKDGNL